MPQLMEGIRLHYTGNDDFYAAHERYAAPWAAGESVPANHAPIGRLEVDPDLLQQIIAETSTLQTSVVIEDFHRYDSDKLHESVCENDLSPFALKFFGTCFTYFRQAVELHAPPYAHNASMSASKSVVGPFERSLANSWHLDNEHSVGRSTTYTLTLDGEGTLYTPDPKKRSDFDKIGYLIHTSGLEKPATYPIGTIVAHDEIMTGHSEPYQKKGTNRIFMNGSIY